MKKIILITSLFLSFLAHGQTLQEQIQMKEQKKIKDAEVSARISADQAELRSLKEQRIRTNAHIVACNFSVDMVKTFAFEKGIAYPSDWFSSSKFSDLDSSTDISRLSFDQLTKWQYKKKGASLSWKDFSIFYQEMLIEFDIEKNQLLYQDARKKIWGPVTCKILSNNLKNI
jgi:hypothetical protein